MGQCISVPAAQRQDATKLPPANGAGTRNKEENTDTTLGQGTFSSRRRSMLLVSSHTTGATHTVLTAELGAMGDSLCAGMVPAQHARYGRQAPQEAGTTAQPQPMTVPKTSVPLSLQPSMASSKGSPLPAPQSRMMAALDCTPSMITICTFQGQVLYQNSSSLAYAGRWTSDTGTIEPAHNYLQQLLSLEPDQLSGLLEACIEADQPWTQVVQVPRSLVQHTCTSQMSKERTDVQSHSEPCKNRSQDTLTSLYSEPAMPSYPSDQPALAGTSIPHAYSGSSNTITRSSMAGTPTAQRVSFDMLSSVVSSFSQQTMPIADNSRQATTLTSQRSQTTAPRRTSCSWLARKLNNEEAAASSTSSPRITSDITTCNKPPALPAGRKPMPTRNRTASNRLVSLLDAVSVKMAVDASRTVSSGGFCQGTASTAPTRPSQHHLVSSPAVNIADWASIFESRSTGTGWATSTAHDLPCGTWLQQSLGLEPTTVKEEEQPCWHEVTVVPFLDPETQQMSLLLTQSDVTERSQLERRLVQVTESQLYMLERMYPRHILEMIACSFQAQTEEGQELTSTRDNMIAMVRELSHATAHHSCVTIMFADICGFTSMAKSVQPECVMTFLNQLFSAFDELVNKHMVYKAETVGDCYIICGGLLDEDEDGFKTLVVDDAEASRMRAARRVINFAVEMLQVAKTVMMPNGEPVKLRVGIHSGPVVSGILGTHLPKFSLYGDTMNTASRMESTSQPGRIQVSDDTFALLKDEDASRWECTGGVEVKGKGVMNTWLLSEAAAVSTTAATKHSLFQTCVSPLNSSKLLRLLTAIEPDVKSPTAPLFNGLGMPPKSGQGESGRYALCDELVGGVTWQVPSICTSAGSKQKPPQQAASFKSAITDKQGPRKGSCDEPLYIVSKLSSDTPDGIGQERLGEEGGHQGDRGTVMQYGTASMGLLSTPHEDHIKAMSAFSCDMLSQVGRCGTGMHVKHAATAVERNGLASCAGPVGTSSTITEAEGPSIIENRMASKPRQALRKNRSRSWHVPDNALHALSIGTLSNGASAPCNPMGTDRSTGKARNLRLHLHRDKQCSLPTDLSGQVRPAVQAESSPVSPHYNSFLQFLRTYQPDSVRSCN